MWSPFPTKTGSLRSLHTPAPPFSTTWPYRLQHPSRAPTWRSHHRRPFPPPPSIYTLHFPPFSSIHPQWPNRSSSSSSSPSSSPLAFAVAAPPARHSPAVAVRRLRCPSAGRRCQSAPASPIWSDGWRWTRRSGSWWTTRRGFRGWGSVGTNGGRRRSTASPTWVLASILAGPTRGQPASPRLSPPPPPSMPPSGSSSERYCTPSKLF